MTEPAPLWIWLVTACALLACNVSVWLKLRKVEQEFQVDHGLTLRDLIDRLETLTLSSNLHALQVADDLVVANKVVAGVATDLVAAQGTVDDVAADLAAAHERADAVEGPHGAASDAAAQSAQRD